jgi:hypothetical protein
MGLQRVLVLRGCQASPIKDPRAKARPIYDPYKFQSVLARDQRQHTGDDFDFLAFVSISLAALGFGLAGLASLTFVSQLDSRSLPGRVPSVKPLF